jgi:hypothetical protein
MKEHDRVPHAAFDTGHTGTERVGKALFARPGGEVLHVG